MDPLLTLSAADLIAESVRVAMHDTAGQNPGVLSCSRWVASHPEAGGVAFGTTLFRRAPVQEGQDLQLVPPPEEMMQFYVIPGELHPGLYIWTRVGHKSRKFPLAFYRRLRAIVRGMPRAMERGSTTVMDFRSPELQRRNHAPLPTRGYMMKDKQIRIPGAQLNVHLHPTDFAHTLIEVATDWPRKWLTGDELKKALVSEPRSAIVDASGAALSALSE